MFMLEKAVTGGRRYWAWLGLLAAVAALGLAAWLRQLDAGLGVTGMSRDVTWGLYIAQFTFFVGVAASAVVVVLPYYLHDYRVFGRVTILGESIAVASVVVSMAFVFVDLGQPARVLNVLRYPTLNSMMFWDIVALSGYLVLNAVITVVTLSAEQRREAPPGWIRPVIVVSIPWAISIHTVTAFLYSGLPGRPLWLTALLAPRFLASAFAAGPALLLLLCLALGRLTRFDAGREPIGKLAVIVAYAMSLHLFFLGLELFTGLYARLPEHLTALSYLFVGLDGAHALVPLMWTSVALGTVALALLLAPSWRRRRPAMVVAAAATIAAVWLEKGLVLIAGGFVPTPLGRVVEYAPTLVEALVTVGVWAVGALLVTVFVRVTLEVRNEV